MLTLRHSDSLFES